MYSTKTEYIYARRLSTDLVAPLPVEGEGWTSKAGALDSALQAGPLAHQEVLDSAARDGHSDPGV